MMIRHVIENHEYKYGTLPVVEIAADSMCYGNFSLLTNDFTVDSLHAKVYEVHPPTTVESRYIKFGPDLFTPSLLFLMGDIKDEKNYIVDWHLDPRVILAVEGDLYVIEFALALSLDDDWQPSDIITKVIIKIRDQVETL